MGSNAAAVPHQHNQGFDRQNEDVQVSFERFKEIMAEVNGLIGRNSYFSWTMLTLYYFGNDMEDTPITERQHLEFYEGDQVTGAFARYYCDSISLVVLFLLGMSPISPSEYSGVSDGGGATSPSVG